MPEKYIFDSEEERDDAEGRPLERALRERLRSVRDAGERRTIAGLLREAGKLPVDVARAALEVGAGLAALSLRAGVDFLRVVPEAVLRRAAAAVLTVLAVLALVAAIRG